MCLPVQQKVACVYGEPQAHPTPPHGPHLFGKRLKVEGQKAPASGELSQIFPRVRKFWISTAVKYGTAVYTITAVYNSSGSCCCTLRCFFYLQQQNKNTHTGSSAHHDSSSTDTTDHRGCCILVHQSASTAAAAVTVGTDGRTLHTAVLYVQQYLTTICFLTYDIIHNIMIVQKKVQQQWRRRWRRRWRHSLSIGRAKYKSLG